MTSSDWTATTLWKLLEEKGQPTETTIHYVRSWLNDVQKLLAKGGTAPLDFTLHDDEHSFRVAQKMVELIPNETLAKLSDFELGLLLQSAYLHDIGMNPRRDIVLQIRDYLFTGSRGSLDPTEAKMLQSWLDDTRPGTQPPIAVGRSDRERLYESEFLTAHFCRHRHNDWSENYILGKSKMLPNKPYSMWVQDLIVLCKSHHYGLHSLMADDFNLRLAGPRNKLVNLRYLAAILRLAEVLEFDPERTPQVVFSHRSIDPRSQIYWYKDHDIVLALNDKNWKILVGARTSDAWIHRAVVDTADAVDVELQTCAMINDQNGFIRGFQLDRADHYVWPWPRQAARDISPRPNSFEYIDGAFRPDPHRILSLLAGTQLYRSPLVAVRKLLQNAYDAVREQIALELLQTPDPNNPEAQSAQSLVHRISIHTEDVGSERWLVCSDTGVGMTRRVIDTHLLVGGSKPRPEVLALQRACAEKGFKLYRSGEFGIGILSYFMLADKMIIETRPSLEAYPDHENHGWRFETDGLDSIGELRRIENQALSRGTTVKLRVKDKLRSSAMDSDLTQYLHRLVSKCPCIVQLSIGDSQKSFSPGWARTEDALRQSVLEQLYQSTIVEESDQLDKEAVELAKQWSPIYRAARSSLRFFGPVEGAFPDNIGTFRLQIPYFELKDGSSIAFFNTADDLLRHMPDDSGIGLTPGNKAFASWRGFSISNIAQTSELQGEGGAFLPWRLSINDDVDDTLILCAHLWLLLFLESRR